MARCIYPWATIISKAEKTVGCWHTQEASRLILPEQPPISMDLKSLRYESLWIPKGHSREDKFYPQFHSQKKKKKRPERLLFPFQTSIKRIRALCQPLAWDNGSVFTLAERQSSYLNATFGSHCP